MIKSLILSALVLAGVHSAGASEAEISQLNAVLHGGKGVPVMAVSPVAALAVRPAPAPGGVFGDAEPIVGTSIAAGIAGGAYLGISLVHTAWVGVLIGGFTGMWIGFLVAVLIYGLVSL